jgi:hypothetical protein
VRWWFPRALPKCRSVSCHLTADDVDNYRDNLLDSTGELITSVSGRPGPDEVAFTADDTGFDFVQVATTDMTISKAQALEGPGADAQWFTADDFVVRLDVKTKGTGKAFV